MIAETFDEAVAFERSAARFSAVFKENQMNFRTAFAAGALLAAVASASAFAQGSMSTMSKADMDKMAACKAMTKDAMMKDAKCVSLSKMQSGSMKSDGMMKKDNMGAGSTMAGPQAKDKMGPMAPSK